VSKVTFVIDHPHSNMSRLTLCGHLLQHYFKQGIASFCLVEDQDYAAFLDDYLWSESWLFLPHHIGEHDPAFCQVSIGTQREQAKHCPCIFNYTSQALQADNPQQHIVEWVSNEAAEKAQMRTVFAQYKAQSIQPHTVRM